MNKREKVLKILVVVSAMLLCVSGCGSKGDLNVADNENSLVDTAAENNKGSSNDNPATEAAVPSPKEITDADEKSQSNQVIETDLKPSEGFEFESNGDGTCTITGIGTCIDKNIVIPLESPDGDTVTLIDEYALYSLKNVDSITLVNCNFEIDKNAFQYGEFTEAVKNFVSMEKKSFPIGIRYVEICCQISSLLCCRISFLIIVLPIL